MRKAMTILLMLALAIPCLAQKPCLVKDEGGETNIRKGPGTKYEIVEKVPDGMFINYVPGTNGWHKVYTTYTSGEEQDFIGYIAASKVVIPKRAGAWKYVAHVKDEGSETNIRKGPGTKYDIVGKVKDNSYILYSGEYGDKWYKVYTQTGALRGYISANKLEPLESPAF